jgi:hypothetical protein
MWMGGGWKYPRRKLNWEGKKAARSVFWAVGFSKDLDHGQFIFSVDPIMLKFKYI